NAARHAAELLGGRRPTFAGEVLDAVQAESLRLWREQLTQVNWELFDRGVEAFTWAALEEVGRAAQSRNVFGAAANSAVSGPSLDEAGRGRHGKPFDETAMTPLVRLRQDLEKPFKDGVFFWRRTEGRSGDLQQEMDTVIQVPGWSNIWTQPIQNRIDMLATGVRTQVGVKLFDRDLQSINHGARAMETVLEEGPGDRNVSGEQNTGEGYLVIKPDRQKAARYGISIGDIQETIEVALGGRMITQTIEGRDRFPVRIRYARDFRE